MTDDAIAAAAHAAGLEQALASFPAEIAAAMTSAIEQAAAMRVSIPTALASRPHAGAPGAAGRGDDATGGPSMPEQERRHEDGEVPPLHYWSLARLGAAFVDGSLTPSTVLDAALARIGDIDGRLDAFVHLDRERAVASARASAERWAAGTPRGPLDGVPVAIKDVIDVAGMPTRCHSHTTASGPVERDAAIVARLRAAGAVIVGKLATHEFAIGGPAFDLPFPPARNPWHRDHHPGGSSSGAGAAVAAGLVPLAIGTDTAGSVRNPASACGVVGLKPGLTVLPVEGVVPLAPTLDHVGLLTRCVGDMRVAAEALGVGAASAGESRVGYVRHFHERDMVATTEVAAALDKVAAVLGTVEVTLPPLGDFALVNRVILQAEGFAVHAHRFRQWPGELSRLTRTALLPGAFLAAETLIAAYRARDALTRAVDGVFAGVDILLTASSMEPPCRIDDPAEVARTYMLQARGPFNVTGHPALTLPAGVTADGLPLSVQLVARMGEEGRLLAVAAAVERAIGPSPSPFLGGDRVSASPGTP